MLDGAESRGHLCYRLVHADLTGFENLLGLIKRITAFYSTFDFAPALLKYKFNFLLL